MDTKDTPHHLSQEKHLHLKAVARLEKEGQPIQYQATAKRAAKAAAQKRRVKRRVKAAAAKAAAQKRRVEGEAANKTDAAIHRCPQRSESMSRS